MTELVVLASRSRGVPDDLASAASYLRIVANKPQERAAEARREKLKLIRQQVRSGELVIRQMTTAERRKWARQHAAVEARLTPAERKSRKATLQSRRKSEARLLELEPRHEQRTPRD